MADQANELALDKGQPAPDGAVDFSNTTPVAEESKEGDFSNGSTTQGNNPDVVFEHNGRKYTNSDLAKKLEHSDEFIEQLKRERAEDRGLLDEVKDQLKQQVDMKELMDYVKENQGGGKGSPVPVDKDGIVSDVLSKLSAQDKQRKEDQNWLDVTKQLSARFGDQTNKEVSKVAGENELSLQEAASLARRKPKVFLSLFGKEQGSTATKVLSGQNSQAVGAGVVKEQPSYMKATTDKERIKLYLDRLNQVST